MKKELYDKTVNRIADLVKLWNESKVYLVGGCVRDSILKEEIKDIDLMIDLEDGPQIFCQWLRQENLAKDFAFYPKYGTSKFTLIVENENVPIECVMPRRETYEEGPRKPDSVEYASIKEDAYRRDFCCNALYQDVCTLELLDLTERGLEDIKTKTLRTPLPSEQTFIDDPLRMLRAFRFWAEKGFTIHPSVYSKIKPYKEYFQLSMERVRVEFGRIIRTERASEIIRALHERELLGYIIPEFEEAWGFNQNSHYHSMNLTDHSLSVLDYIISKDERVRMAALLHDISKYQRWKVKENGEFSFHGHDKESAELSVKILQRLKYSTEDIRVVKKLISEHMRIKSLRNSEGLYNGSKKTTRKIIRDLGDELELCLDLINADNNSHAPEYNMPKQVESFKVAISELGEIPVAKDCPVSGDDIMRKFGLKPGPIIKEIKDIMADWLDEDPSLNSNQLVEKLGEEYGGKGIWVWNSKEGDILCIAESESEKLPYKIKGHIKSDQKEWWKAIEHPKVYTAVKNSKKSRAIFYEAGEKLKEFKDLPGFKHVKIQVDLYGNISGAIEWEGQETDII